MCCRARELRLRPGPDGKWPDPRAPDGVTILAPYEQYQPDAYPGLRTGDAPAAMQLYDLQADPGEQHDVAAAHPDVVKRLEDHARRHGAPGAAEPEEPQTHGPRGKAQNVTAPVSTPAN